MTHPSLAPILLNQECEKEMNMAQYQSGKSRLVRGSLLYLWEEMKTFNKTKLKALSNIISGYFRMRFLENKSKR